MVGLLLIGGESLHREYIGCDCVVRVSGVADCGPLNYGTSVWARQAGGVTLQLL